jgi:transaldolase
MPSSELWQAASATGTALWLDTGDVKAIEQIWTQEFQALTTNNSLLNKEVQKGIYDGLVPEAASMIRGIDPNISEDRLVLEIAFVLNAVHGLRLVRSFDADVSVELHTDLARDTEASYYYGKRFAAIEPDRFIVKVPLTPEGIFAARRLVLDGIRINFTLGFSARQNHLIASLAQPTFVNVFMGRLNAFVKDNGLGDGVNIGEKATLASQRAVRALRKGSEITTRQIGASIRNGRQCLDLLGLDVLTIPTAAAQEFVDLSPALGDVRDRTADDPQVTVDTEGNARGVSAFWDISDDFHNALSTLASQDLDKMSGDDLRSFLAEHSVGDLFGELSPEDLTRIADDGKIPVHGSWADRVQAGTASWDGILTEAAIGAFATDQKALDDRVHSLL